MVTVLIVDDGPWSTTTTSNSRRDYVFQNTSTLTSYTTSSTTGTITNSLGQYGAARELIHCIWKSFEQEPLTFPDRSWSRLNQRQLPKNYRQIPKFLKLQPFPPYSPRPNIGQRQGVGRCYRPRRPQRPQS